MPFDAMFLSAVADELRPVLLGARIEKIQQPARDTVLLQLRGKEKLLLSANPNRPRVHLTRAAFENPAQPPMFCMLLRKHLGGGRIGAVTQPPAERALELSVDCTDEMGTPCCKRLILELMGRGANLILTGEDGRIIDCLRRVDFEMSQVRQVLPGLFYRAAPSQGKKNPIEVDLSDICTVLSDIDTPTRADKWLIDTFAGISPLIAREIAFSFCGETEPDVLALERSRFAAHIKACFDRMTPETMRPTLLLREGIPSDFTYCPITQYGAYLETRQEASFSALLDTFYTERDHEDRMRQKSQALRKTVGNLRDRAVRKLELQRKELAATLDREELRRRGDIVTANLHAIERGQTLLRAVDFYDPDMRQIEIPLKPELSPQQNAARFYKDYARAKHAEKILTEQIAQGELEADYLNGVLDELFRAENERDLSEIRAELEEGGYVRPTDRKKQSKQPPSKPMEYRSSDGYTILVGRNHRQNELLSFKTARRDDLWLHVQKFHGSHVIILSDGETPPDRTVTEAAALAAYHSQARQGQNVPVDVTPVRYLRKPKGGKPGMVIYDRYRTVIVTPSLPTADRDA